jgi:hypothetical protein
MWPEKKFLDENRILVKRELLFMASNTRFHSFSRRRQVVLRSTGLVRTFRQCNSSVVNNAQPYSLTRPESWIVPSWYGWSLSVFFCDEWALMSRVHWSNQFSSSKVLLVLNFFLHVICQKLFTENRERLVHILKGITVGTDKFQVTPISRVLLH